MPTMRQIVQEATFTYITHRITKYFYAYCGGLCAFLCLWRYFHLNCLFVFL